MIDLGLVIVLKTWGYNDMNKLKVISVGYKSIMFNGGIVLLSRHVQDCCESHKLCFSDLSLKDFEGLEFDLSNDNFFKRVDGYGIELLPITGWPVRVPGHGCNSGYYSSQLDLVLLYDNGDCKIYDISECQKIEE